MTTAPPKILYPALEECFAGREAEKSRGEEPRQMTTKGGLENNIPKDATIQYKVYVAVRQVFFIYTAIQRLSLGFPRIDMHKSFIFQ
jgi:hypothetical protein